MSLKDNFNQAVKEILKKDGLVGDDLSKGSRKKSEIDKFMGEVNVPGNMHESLTPEADIVPDNSGYGTNFGETAAPTADDFRQAVHRQSSDPFAEGMSHVQELLNEAMPSREAEGQPTSKFEYQTADESTIVDNEPAPTPAPPPPKQQGTYSGFGGGYNPPPRTPAASPAFRGGRPPETPYYETEETTVISRNTRISGDISSFANVTVEGSVQGDIKLTKNISVSGKVVGNIECNNAVMAGAQMQGSISSKGQVQMDHDSVLLGNIDTQYLDLNGRIKGNVDVGGKAEFKNDAVIVGDITASTISVIDGAVIKGFVNTTFMQESTSNVFPEAITVGEV